LSEKRKKVYKLSVHLHNPPHMADLAIPAARGIQVIASLFPGEARLLAPSALLALLP